MRLFNWLKRPQQPASPSSVPLDLTPEQRGPTNIRYGGLTITLPYKWERFHDEPAEPGAEEYRNTILPEQLFITPRRFVRPLSPDELKAMLLTFPDCQRGTFVKKFGDQFQADPVDVRMGQGQAEVRFFARAKDFQAAYLHRGDNLGMVSVSFYRYLDASRLDLRGHATHIFDLAQLDPTPA